MKKLLSIALGLVVLPLWAEVIPVYEDDTAAPETEQVAAPIDQDQAADQAQTVMPTPAVVVSPRAAINTQRNNIQSTTYSSRAVSSRTGSAAPIVRISSNTRPVSTRTAAVQNRVAAGSRTTTRTTAAAANIVQGRYSEEDQERAVQARSATTTNNLDSTDGLYSTTSTTPSSARVGVTTTSVMPSGIRSVSARSATTTTPTLFNTTDTSTKSNSSSSGSAEELAAQTEFCKTQYTACMDNFCAVLDDNQGRCTCSASITKYEKVEDALKQATTDLQDIATKIRYLGLSKDEVISLFAQTEAEQQMGSSTDSSVLKSSLDNIQKLLIDPKSSTVSTGSVLTSDFTNFDFGNGFDISSFITSDDSISNQRGDALFDTARSRCSSVITDCKKQGVDTSLVTANYDLEIDKQCIAYERSLIDSNDKMTETIRNATTVLQQARLTVSQSKNKYDLKGCVNALDTCMVDDFVCGDNYKNCLDISGQYIVNGNVVVGSTPSTTVSPGFVDNWKYGTSNAFYPSTGITQGTLSDMIANSSDTDNNLVKFMKTKIGSINSDGRATGMCASILNQCQNYTYSGGAYQENNNVIREFLSRTLVNIKAQQDQVLASYGESCRQQMITCFVKNGATSTSPASFQETIVKSCLPYVKTCGAVNNMTVFDGDVASYVCPTGQKLLIAGTGCQP